MIGKAHKSQIQTLSMLRSMLERCTHDTRATFILRESMNFASPLPFAGTSELHQQILSFFFRGTEGFCEQDKKMVLNQRSVYDILP